MFIFCLIWAVKILNNAKSGEASIKVAGKAVDQQLGSGGEAVRPTIAAAVPTEEGERAGLGEEAHTAEQVRLV